MGNEQRKQIRLILDNADDLARKAVRDRLKAIYADHAAKGMLQSGGTVKVAVRAVEEEAHRLIVGSLDQVAPVAKDVEAYAMIRLTFDGFLSFLNAELDGIAKMAVGGAASLARFRNAAVSAHSLLADAQTRLNRQLELHRFVFIESAPKAIMPTVAQSLSETLPATKNRGGKPLARHWDDMWSTIAVQLYIGDLEPKTQADISRAMMGWFIDHGIEIGETAIRDRARQLWLKYEAAQ